MIVDEAVNCVEAYLIKYVFGRILSTCVTIAESCRVIRLIWSQERYKSSCTPYSVVQFMLTWVTSTICTVLHVMIIFFTTRTYSSRVHTKTQHHHTYWKKPPLPNLKCDPLLKAKRKRSSPNWQTTPAAHSPTSSRLLPPLLLLLLRQQQQHRHRQVVTCFAFTIHVYITYPWT